MADDKEGDRWTVRGVSASVRQKAAAAALRRDETTGEWVSRVLSAAADREADDTVILPGGHGGQDGRRTQPADSQPDVSAIIAVVQAAAALSAAGVPLSAGAAREINAGLRAAVRASRRLPVPAARPPRPSAGLMIDAD